MSALDKNKLNGSKMKLKLRTPKKSEQTSISVILNKVNQQKFL